jgi:hypothetical protein
MAAGINLGKMISETGACRSFLNSPGEKKLALVNHKSVANLLPELHGGSNDTGKVNRA